MTGKKQDQPTALEQRGDSDDGRLFSPSSARNSGVICDAWREFGPAAGKVLEIGSGTGQHAVTILKACPDLHWTASDFDTTNHPSIRAWAVHEGVSDRMEGPLSFDASLATREWGVDDDYAAIYCANVLHISPWAAGRGVILGAGELLGPGGRLVLYGPYKRHGEHTASSNAAFDESLRSRMSDWGVRDLDLDVLPVAEQSDLELVTVREMPANNLVVVFQKR